MAGKTFKRVILLLAGMMLFGCAGQKVTETVDFNAGFKSGEYVQRTDNFMIILDTSGSMAETYGGLDMTTYSKNIVRRIADKIPESMKLVGALRTFGVGASYGSKDTDLVYWPVEYSKPKFDKALDKIKRVSGKSRLNLAIEAAGDDLKHLEGQTAVIILSDGKIEVETCAAAMKEMKKRYGGNLCVHTIHIKSENADINQNAVDREKLDRIAGIGECGISISSDTLDSDKSVADFVERVFLDKDADRDKIGDRLDKCPETPFGLAVDEDGCPLDSDGDGVTDESDRCPDTPDGVKINDEGCPVDSDNDSVPDYLDKCPNTPVEIQVGPEGCPLDSDADDVPNYLDRCPNTPRVVKVDAWGCPIDTDKDGVPDSLDECPKTVLGAQVDPHGCALDSDADGVIDFMDSCPNSPKDVKVDARGCPGSALVGPTRGLMYGDASGVPEDETRGIVFEDAPAPDDAVHGITETKPVPAPDTPPPSAYPAEKPAEVELGRYFIEGADGAPDSLLFSPGSDLIHPLTHPWLDQIAARLKAESDLKAEIKGHTDDIERESEELSARRAMAVMEYLLDKGVDPHRISSTGYGGTEPRNSNASPVGQADNRRVEIIILP